MKSLKMFAVLMAMVLLFSSHAVRAEAPALKVGQPAPDFSLPDQDGKTRKLVDFRGQWLALYFYVKDDTPGCTEQACKFRDDIGELKDLGARVVGVSVDDAESHASFAKKYNLPFPLLADSKGEMAARYGSLRGDGSMAKRNTFLIDPEGRIARIYLSASTSRNSAQVIEDLKKLKGS
ncbi:peroxiredoxin [Nitrosovibrio sp. Nv4]|uniref:peroxiredoxin n=1 Tax=Nitrosovibrio sp. Nv4 TaxID=1945880 RepID=UPI000BCC96FC|nr:peroxiredoxin [Nitrosovibrio sp. Nv4]SOD40243.1 peroxiredoxin Q/BCP [Nitrosovibrio sp. Nv4]